MKPEWKDSEWENMVRTAIEKKDRPFHSLIPWPFGKVWAYGIMSVFALFISFFVIRSGFVKDNFHLKADLTESAQQDVISMTMISKESGTKIVWFFDKNFELEE